MQAPPPGPGSQVVTVFGLLVSQAWKQPLQCSTVPNCVSQPKAFGSQSPNPGSHWSTTHVRETQRAVAFGKSHSNPQLPQLLTSFSRLKPSSVTPSQSLSRPSQISAVGKTSPRHGPHVPLL